LRKAEASQKESDKLATAMFQILKRIEVSNKAILHELKAYGATAVSSNKVLKTLKKVSLSLLLLTPC
jgi:hypothetical protein